MIEIKFRTYFENRFWYFTLNEIMERVACYHGDWDIQALRAEKQQFTGFCDCKQTEKYPKGQEVYEGDILEIWVGRDKQDKYYLVEDIRELYLEMNRDDSYYRISKINVVGNKWQNPELIKIT